MMTKKKKGFTIVELVIVIAVIGILAAVLIPTFTSLVEEARQSNDRQIVYYLNEAVKEVEIDRVKEGKTEKASTMHETLEAMDDKGFGVAKLTPTSNECDIIWDSTTNRFALIDESGVVVAYDETVAKPNTGKKENLWKVYKTVASIDSKYSAYYAGTETDVSVTVEGVGFDAGYNTGLTAVNYNGNSGTHDVVIRTNSASTSLTIDAANDTIKHYDAVGSVNIIAVDPTNSYHENGTVAFLEVKNGRVALEAGAEVEHIHLTATGEGEGAYFNNITVAKAANVEMPEFSRDPVEIPEGGKLVVALQEGTEKVTSSTQLDYVWLTAFGIYEQVTVSDSKDDAKNNYAATSTTASQEQKTAAQQIANNISATVGGNNYTLTATTTDGGQNWIYALESDIVDNITEDVTVAVTTEEQETVVTVSVADEELVTAKENGSSKDEEKSRYVAELISNDAELRAFLASTKQKGKLAKNISNPTVETKSTRYVYANGRDVELDLAGFTLDGYEICVNDGSTLTLTGNGIVNLDGEEPIFITNGNLVIAGVTISGKVGGTSYSNRDSSYASGLVYFYHKGDQNITMNLIIADDTINYISVLDGEGSTTYKGNCADILAQADGEGTLTFNVVGQEKGNGILNMSTTGNSESYANGIREYAGAGHVDTIVRNCVLNISAAGNLNNGYTNNFILENIIGSVFSQDCSDYCISGYATIYSNSSAKYEFEQITEQNASIEVTNSDSTKFYAVNLGSAMRNVGNGGTIKLLKNVVYNGTVDDLTIDSFNIDLNSKTVTGSWGFFNPNETNYNVHDTVTVTISNGSIDGCLNLYHNTLIILDHIAFKNTSSTSYDRGLYLNTSISPTTYPWATIYSKIVANNCTFDNVRVDIYGGSGAQHVDVKFDGCTFTNNTASSYSAFAENSYIYGDVEFDDCSFDIRLSATYKYAVELGNNSSNGNNPVNLIVKDTVIIVRSNSYASHKPISGISATSTIFTVTENGTNSYKVVNNSNDTQFRMTDVYGTTLGE